MIGWLSRGRRIKPFKTVVAKIKPIDKYVDSPDHIVLADKIVQAFGQECSWRAD